MRWRRRGGSRLNWLSIALMVLGLALGYNAWSGVGYAWLQQGLMARGIFIFDQPDTPVLVGAPDDQSGVKIPSGRQWFR